MKKIIIIFLVALYAIFVGCSALISVGDNNANTHTINKK